MNFSGARNKDQRQIEISPGGNLPFVVKASVVREKIFGDGASYARGRVSAVNTLARGGKI